MKTESKFNAIIDSDADRLINIFKDLHENPELGFMEFRTAGIVAKELQALGYDVKTRIGQTGVAGIMKNGEGPVVMYRAGMDCNAVKEATGLPYASTKTAKRKNDGGHDEEVPVAHCCGHDAHVTWLLGVAKVMAETKRDWKGTLVLVAQPAEELILGAVAMVRDGMYEKGVPKPDYLVGLHTTPAPTGMVTCTSGELNAGTDQLDVTFYGIGGHGSSPHLAKDPVLMACAAVIQYQFIVSRGIDPLRAAVVTVGSVQAGADNNVIPSSALVKINLRWYNEQDRTVMLTAIEQINRSIAAAYNLPEQLYPKTVMKGGSKVLANDAEMAATMAPVLQKLLGDAAVMTEMPKLMGSDDFHHLVIENENPRYLYIYVGTAKPEHCKKALADGKSVPYSNHNPDYQVDLDAIPIGVKVGVASVGEFLRRTAQKASATAGAGEIPLYFQPQRKGPPDNVYFVLVDGECTSKEDIHKLGLLHWLNTSLIPSELATPGCMRAWSLQTVMPLTKRVPEAGDRGEYLTVYEVQTDDIVGTLAARLERIENAQKASNDSSAKFMKELSVIAYKAIGDLKTRFNTPPAPYGNKATPPIPEGPPTPGTRRFLLAVETNLKDPAHAAEFNDWYDNVHIPDVLTSPGYNGVQRLERVTTDGPSRAKNLTFYEIHSDDLAWANATRDARRIREMKIGAYDGGAVYMGKWAQAYYEPMGEVMVSTQVDLLAA